MTRSSWVQLKETKLDAMSTTERAEYDRAFAEAKLAADVGERIHDAREAAGLGQRELARGLWVRGKRPSTASSLVASAPR